MAESIRSQHICMSEGCEQTAGTYCKTCRQAFCSIHDEAHTELLKVLKTPHKVITVEEYETAQREENLRYCSQHEKSSVVMACEHCYKPMCLECLDEAAINKNLMECQSPGIDQHKTRNIKQVSKKIQDELSDILSELRIKEMAVSDGMKERRQLYDEQMEEHRDDLEKLDAKVEELHKLIDTHHKEWKEMLVDHMGRKKEMLDELEAEFTVYQKSCQEIHNRATQYRKQSDELIVRDRWNVKTKLQPLMSFQLHDNPKQFTKLSLTITDVPVTFPISFQTIQPKLPLFQQIPTLREPTSLEFKEEINTASNTNCVLYNRAGKLLHAGTYPLAGLYFTPNFPSDGDRTSISLYEHRASLYIMQNYNSNYHIHAINLNNQSVSLSIITFPGSGSLQHMTVNDDYIIIADYGCHLIKVYSTANRSHMFDIKDSSTIQYPWGLAMLGDTLLVGSHNHRVVNMTISATPDVRWICKTEIGNPCSIAVVQESQIIMVASSGTKTLCILSYQGEKLSTLSIPQCTVEKRYDISVCNNQIAVSDESSKIKIYEIKYEK